MVKYESPAVHGFFLTASLGTKEFWDVALRYKGEFGDVKFEAGVGYLEVIDGAELAVCAAAEVDKISPDGQIRTLKPGLPKLRRIVQRSARRSRVCS